MKKQILIFDLDNTLSESRTPIDAEIAKGITDLLSKHSVAIISGESFEEFKPQVLSRLSISEEKMPKLFILPTSGAELWTNKNGGWEKVYSYPMTEKLRKKITDAIIRAVGISKNEAPKYIEDRESQVTYSALGIYALLEEKRKWDPDQKKRRELLQKLAPKFPECSLRIGGTTSVDFTLKGIDKAFGVQKFIEYLNANIADAVFVGDALYEGGNDSTVKKTGIDTITTSGPLETKKIIQKFLAV
ncbi:MAG TPA: HAD-IIB family hydrolase [Candidatus Paceibacterota bacterium]|nr:HAD-IIB family hydrolase [Candidatus Paceibacterota bacterium]